MSKKQEVVFPTFQLNVCSEAYFAYALLNDTELPVKIVPKFGSSASLVLLTCCVIPEKETIGSFV